MTDSRPADAIRTSSPSGSPAPHSRKPRWSAAVVRSRFGVLQRDVEAGAGQRGERDAVLAGLGVGCEDVRTVAQHVGDADGVVVGIEQPALFAVDGGVTEHLSRPVERRGWLRRNAGGSGFLGRRLRPGGRGCPAQVRSFISRSSSNSPTTARSATTPPRAVERTDVVHHPLDPVRPPVHTTGTMPGSLWVLPVRRPSAVRRDCQSEAAACPGDGGPCRGQGHDETRGGQRCEHAAVRRDR